MTENKPLLHNDVIQNLNITDHESKNIIIDRNTNEKRVRAACVLRSRSLVGADEKDYYANTPTVPTSKYDSLPKYGKERAKKKAKNTKGESRWKFALGQVPAVALGCLLNLMWAVPFGVAYFPIAWRAQELGPDPKGGDDTGMFPYSGKDALGIRMFLFSSMIGQLVFTFASGFKNPMGMQMIENVPFCHSLAFICIAEQGWGVEALTTLFFLFGASSIFVGAVFFLLGWLELGKVVYYIPSHVLMGCISGIGVFIVLVAVEVTIHDEFDINLVGLENFIHNFNLIAPVIVFEIILRCLQAATRLKNGQPRYPLLPPIYFCAITPFFYLLMLVFGIKWKDAQAAGYFFPSIDSCDPTVNQNCSEDTFWSSVFNIDLFDMWRPLLDMSSISWTAVYKSIPTLIGLTAFSLIHVPINIPAFAVSTGVESDMNKEMVAHGYSNALSGILGGLQNYLCYSNSMAFAKSCGEGKMSSLALTVLTLVLFFIGPNIASYIPCCMAGTLLVHLGLELFLEGVLDTYENYDALEYFSVWLIILVMTAFGMSAALVAGAISAVATYAMQSVKTQNPVRGYMSGQNLRSSRFLSIEADQILNDKKCGRNKILVVQLQGQLFFGNISQLTDTLNSILSQKQDANDDVWIIIIDFTLVTGIDSSAAQAIAKLKGTMHKDHKIDLSIYVTGTSAGFPCQYNLEDQLVSSFYSEQDMENVELMTPYVCKKSPFMVKSPFPTSIRSPFRSPFKSPFRSPFANPNDSIRQENYDNKLKLRHFVRRAIYVAPSMPQIPADKVCETLDDALLFAEEVLITIENPKLLVDNAPYGTHGPNVEKDIAYRYLTNLCAGQNPREVDKLFSLFRREVYVNGQILWKQGSISDSLKLLVKGDLLSIDEEKNEKLVCGSIVGELGLVLCQDRMTTVKCTSEEAVVYSLEEKDWKKLVKDSPEVAQCIYMIVVHYLAHRVQQVQHGIFETRCLPI